MGVPPEIPDWIERARNDASTSPMLKGFADAITRYRDGSEPYIKLLDGGLVDNYGLAGFTIAKLSATAPYAPLTAKQATKIRRVLFLVIDGGVGPSGAWIAAADGPTAPEIVMAAANTAINSSVRAELHGLRSHDVRVARRARALAMWSFDAGSTQIWCIRRMELPRT